jgi:D-alanyl-lipoteichoic acid acyltransferase DltB (MBOAT superfamily)
MLFPTLEFAVFFVVVFVANWLLRPVSAIGWRLMILVASLYFYAYWDARFVALLLGSILFNHLLGERIGASLDDGEPTPASRWWVRIAVAGNLALLGWFKYYGFFSLQVANWFEDVGIDVRPSILDVLLPVGISFFTFQAMSYVIDIGRGHLQPTGLLDFAVYLSFFPHLVAGPIVRASEFLPQLVHRPDPRFVRSGEAFWLILAGLFKKVVISSYLADSIVDRVFAVPGDYNAVDVLVAVYAYAIQIYADFSGYTDIAIGVALLLGFRFPQNFDAPYRSLSIQDFWRRWHMTLSRWLRDYLYIPLGGNRGGSLLTYRNLMLTMVLGGLWHGAAWTFVIWGAIHGGALATERALRERWTRTGRQPSFSPAVRPVVQWIATFNVVCLAWVFFRSTSLTNAWTMLGRLTVWGEPTQLASLGIVAVITAAIASQFVSIGAVHRAQAVFARTSWAVQGAVFGTALVAIDVLGPEGVAPFIYFQF